MMDPCLCCDDTVNEATFLIEQTQSIDEVLKVKLISQEIGIKRIVGLQNTVDLADQLMRAGKGFKFEKSIGQQHLLGLSKGDYRLRSKRQDLTPLPGQQGRLSA